MLTIHVWPKRLKEFLLTHPLYKSPRGRLPSESDVPYYLTVWFENVNLVFG